MAKKVSLNKALAKAALATIPGWVHDTSVWEMGTIEKADGLAAVELSGSGIKTMPSETGFTSIEHLRRRGEDPVNRDEFFWLGGEVAHRGDRAVFGLAGFCRCIQMEQDLVATFSGSLFLAPAGDLPLQLAKSEFENVSSTLLQDDLENALIGLLALAPAGTFAVNGLLDVLSADRFAGLAHALASPAVRIELAKRAS